MYTGFLSIPLEVNKKPFFITNNHSIFPVIDKTDNNNALRMIKKAHKMSDLLFLKSEFVHHHHVEQQHNKHDKKGNKISVINFFYPIL